jgi:cell shape-determining protein MreC
MWIVITPAFFSQNESTSKERLMEIQAKVMELEYVLTETKEKLSFVQHQKSQLESHLTDSCEMLKQKQNLISVLEEQKTQLSSALDEVSLVSECESVNSRSAQVIERCFHSLCARLFIL